MKTNLFLIILLTCSINVSSQTPGSLDLTFDSDGKLTTDFFAGYDEANSVAIQSDGKIVVAGYAYNGTNNDFALTRYNTNGSLDLTFDGDGKLTTDFFANTDVAYSVAIQSDGKIVAAGYAINGTNYDFALTRYNSNGSLDLTFDSDGKLTTDFFTNSDVAYSVAIQSDGKIVAAGYAVNGTNIDFTLARYNNCIDPTASATNTGPYCVGATIQLNSVGGSATDDWVGPNAYSQNNV